MAIQTSMITHLAKTLGGITETTATGALGFILNQSEEARKALDNFIRQAGARGIHPSNNIKTEWPLNNHSRPDLTVFDDHGHISLIIELKFDAPLQPTQPVSYIEQLPKANPSGLIFIAPQERIKPLWTELCHRTTLTELLNTNGTHSGKVPNSNHTLLLAPWGKVIQTLRSAATRSKDPRLPKHVQELQELVEGLTTSHQPLLNLETIAIPPKPSIPKDERQTTPPNGQQEVPLWNPQQIFLN